MERMLVVIFPSEAHAFEAADTLQRLNEDGMVGVTGEWVLTKSSDGAVSIVKTDDTLPEGTMGGTAVGSLIGLFAGPVGLAVGAAAGAALGATADIARARVDQDFVADMTNRLEPGKAALVAEIDEEETDAVDASMQQLSGQVFRRDLSDVANVALEHRVSAIRSRIKQAKADIARGREARKEDLRTIKAKSKGE